MQVQITRPLRLRQRPLALAALAVAVAVAASCKTAVSTGSPDPTFLPFLKNSPNECYYLDEFMPVPDSLVAGKAGSLDLRYYSYRMANYKEWRAKEIMLSFYSKNGRCWSLFEEYYITE
jgi:hypothetical protein